MAEESTASARFQSALESAWQSIRRTIPRMDTDRPRIGLPDLTYERCGPSDWVDSFWSGQLWLAYEQTSDTMFLAAARAQRPYFADRLNRPESHTHDLGFLYTLSAVADRKVTGDAEARRMGIAAADALTKRYNPAGRFIQAWNPWPTDTPAEAARKLGKIIVDCMENLALLYWAAAETGEARYAEIATAHADTSLRYLVRPDGSTYHTFDFDPKSGSPLGGSTHQGFADESCWSRGQAWAIHGFAMTFRYTDDARFQRAAMRLADYAIAHLTAHPVPFWDYRLTEDAPHYRDSSAAAIMAAGLFVLADTLGNRAVADQYRVTARTILNALIAGYMTVGNPDAEGLLIHGASNVNAGLSDALLPYGDYFFVEALLRALGRTSFYW
jgi:unsaturated chondroitin disaccharide hydrolase